MVYSVSPFLYQLSRVLSARPLRVKPEAEVEYCVTVATGDVRGGGTDAAVFLTLAGTKGSSPKTQLQVSYLARDVQWNLY